MKWIFTEVHSGCGEMCWRFSLPTILTRAIRVEFFGDEIDRITEIDVLTGEIQSEAETCRDFPGISLCCATWRQIQRAAQMPSTKNWKNGLPILKSEDKLLEAQRIAERTNFDVEMMRETGFCSGIENYSTTSGRTGTGTAAVYAAGLFPG